MVLRPHSLADACAALAEAPAAILSGGTDFYPALGERPRPARVLDLSRVNGLDRIDHGPNGIRIGARVTWAALARAPLPPALDGLRAAAREVGSPQIQNVATLAGNLCNASPAADGAPPLLALDAEVELASTTGTRLVPLQAFLIGNRATARRADEILAAIHVPLGTAPARSAFLKLGSRRYLVISVAMVAVVVEAEHGRVARARVAVGSCSAAARRLPALEAALTGADADGPLGTLAEADHLSGLSPISDGRASAEYRDEAALQLVRRALDACRLPPDGRSTVGH